MKKSLSQFYYHFTSYLHVDLLVLLEFDLKFRDDSPFYQVSTTVKDVNFDSSK